MVKILVRGSTKGKLPNLIGLTFPSSWYSHFQLHLQQVAIKLNMLSKAGFDTTGLGAESKILLYKSFVRPLLFYGLDCFNLCKSDIDRVISTEGNTVKTSLNLYNRIHTTELFLALNMDINIKHHDEV